jgi:putative FmdB family regulatory protein
MPTYEFVCTACGQKFEELKKAGDNDAKCPVCDGKAERVMSVPNVIVSGAKSSVDSVIGADAERRWSQIADQKKQRDRQLGTASSQELTTKDNIRRATILKRQQDAYSVIDKAKKEAGITKKEELNHLLKG